ncbi:HNH endonuclease [Streptomyces sp. NPDC006482]|uniref:HNH endonuclease n=1 Tax=Streptomyces sp. NPDC006482 TaxID=3154306 RepID=UPI0033B51916
MIRLSRVDLPQETTTLLGKYTKEIAAQATEQARKDKAKNLWAGRRTVRPALLAALTEMAPGHARCMYCGDSEGTDIDHFDPKHRTPLRTFDWLNHLLSCSYCNSGRKGSRFPLDADGAPLLVDPTLLDPLDHLRLVLPLGEYQARTPQGQACIDVFGLNSRPVLVKGRVDAYVTAHGALLHWRHVTDKGQHDKAREIVRVSWDRPLVDVLVAMFHQSEHAAAEALFAGEEDVLTLLRDPELREGFLSRA